MYAMLFVPLFVRLDLAASHVLQDENAARDQQDHNKYHNEYRTGLT